jgi:hypothetical protein
VKCLQVNENKIVSIFHDWGIALNIGQWRNIHNGQAKVQGKYTVAKFRIPYLGSPMPAWRDKLAATKWRGGRGMNTCCFFLSLAEMHARIGLAVW